MNLALTFCWREWRAQRGVLLAFTTMGLAALCLVFFMVPEAWWLESGKAALALSWFVALGVVGVVAFVAPALVRSEFGVKDDQFVRRLPGALLPSFAGKLLFLVLTAAALPLACLLAGEGFLLAIGRPWHGLFFYWEHNGNVSFQWPWPALWMLCAALLVPWVWAIGTWLPGGRMALGGTVLFDLLCGLVIFAVLRQSPGIEKGITWQAWLGAIPVVGLVVAAVSWTKGRRGGGAWRSAKCGLAAAAIGFVPPATWFAARTWDYHHPDPQHLAHFETLGLTPDLRYVLVTGKGHEDYGCAMPFRVDLADGSASQLGGITSFTPEVRRPAMLGLLGQARHWGCYDYDGWLDHITQYRVLDLATGEWIASSSAANVEAMRREVAAQLPPPVGRPDKVLLHAPGGVAVSWEGHEVCFEVAPGRVERVRWCDDELPVTLRAIGHGFKAFGKTERIFDLTTRKVLPTIDSRENVWLWRGTVLQTQRSRPMTWWRRDRGATEVLQVPALAYSEIIGFLDDDRLACRRLAPHGKDLFVWRPADDVVTKLVLPIVVPERRMVWPLAPLYQFGSLLPRDGTGRVWLFLAEASTTALMRLDPDTLRVELLPYRPEDRGSFRVLAWLDGGKTFLAQELATIQRVDVATGARTQLFPRGNEAK